MAAPSARPSATPGSARGDRPPAPPIDVRSIDTASGLGTTVEIRVPVEFKVSEEQDARQVVM